jgi:protein-tyrosine phosphatase
MLPAEIPLVSASNLRDLGGWPTQDGRRVRRGLVYRSAALTALVPQDQAAVDALEFRSVVDLRGNAERTLHPVHIPGATTFTFAIEAAVGAELTDILRTGCAAPDATPDSLMALLAEAYRSFALQYARQYGDFLALLLDRERTPLLVHCSAGKDRTGFGAALLLSALGVAWEDVVEDYLATNRLWRREILRRLTLPDDMKDVLLGAHQPLLEAAFAAIRQEYGSLQAYLAGPIGLSPAARQTLQHHLLES